MVVSDVAVEGGEQTVRLIEEDGGEASFVEADVSKAAQVEALVGRAVEAYGRLSARVKNQPETLPQALLGSTSHAVRPKLSHAT